MEELIDADAVDTLRVCTNVLLDLATLAGEAGRTFAPDVIDEVGTVGSQQTRLFSAIVNVGIAENTFPAGRAVADESTLRLE